MPYLVRYYVCNPNNPNIGNWEVYGLYERLSQAIRHYKRLQEECAFTNKYRQSSKVTKFQILQNNEVITEC